MCATSPVHLILHLITLIIFGEQVKSWNSSLHKIEYVKKSLPSAFSGLSTPTETSYRLQNGRCSKSSKWIENKIEIQDTDSSRDARGSVITLSEYFKNPCMCNTEKIEMEHCCMPWCLGFWVRIPFWNRSKRSVQRVLLQQYTRGRN
jgi:hypothetical protein